jgi:hypothetical protein
MDHKTTEIDQKKKIFITNINWGTEYDPERLSPKLGRQVIIV